jgi:hypothetical protein
VIDLITVASPDSSPSFACIEAMWAEIAWLRSPWSSDICASICCCVTEVRIEMSPNSLECIPTRISVSPIV